MASANELLSEAIELRRKYAYNAREGRPRSAVPAERLGDMSVAALSFEFVDGVAVIRGLEEAQAIASAAAPTAHTAGAKNDLELASAPGSAVSFIVPSIHEVYADLERLMSIRSAGPVHTYSYSRLRLLEAQFNIHTMMNAEAEAEEIAANPHRDFYNVRKVDTHIHHSAASNAKHLLRFIKKKAKKFGHEVVHVQKNSDTGEDSQLTLLQVFDKLQLKPYDLNIDKLAVMADRSTMHRFDKFNLKYNPCGESLLRTIFLKTDNHLQVRADRR